MEKFVPLKPKQTRHLFVYCSTFIAGYKSLIDFRNSNTTDLSFYSWIITMVRILSTSTMDNICEALHSGSHPIYIFLLFLSPVSVPL